MLFALPLDLLELCRQVCGDPRLKGELSCSPEEIAEITEIVAQNQKCERAVPDINGDKPALAEYIMKVARNYAVWHPLVYALRARDHQAWEELWQELRSKVPSALRSVLRDSSWFISEERYDEFVQEACLDIFRGRYPYDCEFQAWTFRVLTNRIRKILFHTNNPLDHPTKAQSIPQMAEDNGVEEEVLLDWIVYRAAPPPDFVESVHQRERLNRAIAQLPSVNQRQVAIWTWLEPLSDEEIARRLGRTSNAVYKIRQRARANLKRILEDSK